MGVNSVHTFDCVSPCSTHCLPSGQWTKVWELYIHNWPVDLSSAVLMQQWLGVRFPTINPRYACVAGLQ